VQKTRSINILAPAYQTSSGIGGKRLRQNDEHGTVSHPTVRLS